MQVYEFENFLNPSECDYILRWFSSANRQPENGEELFDGRTIPYKYVDEDTVNPMSGISRVSWQPLSYGNDAGIQGDSADA